MNYREICLQVVDLSRQVGAFIRNESEKFTADKIQFKGFNDLVSYVDREAEKQILNKLKLILPEAALIAEEKGMYDPYFMCKDAYCWIVDPLDGTTNFIHGIPTYAISIALYKGNKGLVGVVYEINRDEMFASYLGAPLLLNDKTVKVSSQKTMAEGLIATGFPYYDFTLQSQYMNLLNDVLKSCQGVRRIGAAAVDLAYVACGRFEAFFEYNLKPWDIAAGAFLVQQAGGRSTDFKGEDNYLNSNHIIAGNTQIHEELLKKIDTYFTFK